MQFLSDESLSLMMALYIYSNIIIMVIDYYSSLTNERLVFR